MFMSNQLGGSSTYVLKEIIVFDVEIVKWFKSFFSQSISMLLIRSWEQIKFNNRISTYRCYRNLHLSIALSSDYHHDHKIKYFRFMVEFRWNISNNFNNLLHLLLLDSWLSATNGFISFLFNAFSLIYLYHVAAVKFLLIMQ